MVFLCYIVDPALTRGQTEQNLSNRIHPPVLTLDIEVEGGQECVCVCVRVSGGKDLGMCE